MKKCIILFSNAAYLSKCVETITQIRNVGEYSDDIVVVVGDDLESNVDELSLKMKDFNVIVKYFKENDRSEIVKILRNKPIGDGREVNKIFQWHKIFCFDVYFKQWDVCFYIDSGMKIFKPLDKFFQLDFKDSLLAHSDSFPTYEWKLSCQFDRVQFPDLYNELNKTYNLDIDYFQSGIMIYDTNIIESDTYDKLKVLGYKYINSRTNEQGILNIYFNCIKNIWKQVKIKDEETHYYDYWERDNLKYSDYIMLKYSRTL
jgi:hypothetical protein